MSKAGYIQGRNYAISQERRRRGEPFPELVPFADDLEHCIHPDFLKDQLRRSLQRLQIETIDVYLLHNPEYFLGWALQQGQSPDRSRAEYARRIENAFRHLETEVARGRIRCYGISSNTFPSGGDDPQFTCLERVWQTAEAVSSDHHFRVIQLPMNLMEPDAVLLANQPSGKTTLAAARENNLGVLVNRPLNALAGNRLLRLTDVIDLPRVPEEEIRRRIESLRQAEKDFIALILPDLDLDAATCSRLEIQLQCANALDRSWNKLQGFEHWRQVQDEALLPRVRGIMAHLETHPSAGRQTQKWRRSYRQALDAVLQAIGGVYAEPARQQASRIKAALAEADSTWAAAAPLSRLAVRALRSTSGISCVLVGMRQEAYVEDMLGELQQPVAVRERQSAWRKIQKSIIAIG